MYGHLVTSGIHAKVGTGVLYKHVVLSESARIQEELNTLSCSQLALRITLLQLYILYGHTVWCCLSILFWPPPSVAAFLFSSRVAKVFALCDPYLLCP